MKLKGMDTFTALSDPRRREIIAYIGAHERAAGDIAARSWAPI